MDIQTIVAAAIFAAVRRGNMEWSFQMFLRAFFAVCEIMQTK